MNKDKAVNRARYGSLPSDSEGIDTLAELALDLRWSWNHSTDELWQDLDEDLWKHTHNPWIVLQAVSLFKLEKQLADPVFQQKMNTLLETKKLAEAEATWFQQKFPKPPLTTVAYFSMEFMLSEALPIYVGGLGNVAGDQLKAASDLGVPVVAVGLLYQQGYFRQEIDQDGDQLAFYPFNDPGQLPITPLRLPSGEWLRIEVDLAGNPVWLRSWQVQVGRLRLYLLDSNDATNMPIHRGITDELYGGGAETRIQQEIMLGIGGFKLLKSLGIKPEVCHMNEGHAAFLILERANQFMKENGTSFDVALAVTRAGNLFTSHTAVAAGFDHFGPELMKKYLGEYAQNDLHISFDDLMALGRQNPHNSSEGFNMAFLAIHGSSAVNGVSRLHGKVSRRLFEPLFSRWPNVEVPVGHVTNGVHMPGWDSQMADQLWTNACGKARWMGDLNLLEQNMCEVPKEKLWALRNECRSKLVEYVRKKMRKQFQATGRSGEIVPIADHIFNPQALTLGFARRFVSYKRPNLLLFDEQRFIRILTNPERPVQLVIAGKAPPFDEFGKSLIKQWVQFIQRHDLYEHVVFLSDYDMLLTEHLVQGADVWVNTPRRPWEACGTSGMKVLVNGGLNLSELDGWWAEAFTPEVGWALGDRLEQGDDPMWDEIEAEALYKVLETEVVPEFYTRSDQGIPEIWLKRMLKSMSILTPQFSANRTVRQYTESYYLPAAIRYNYRAAAKGVVGEKIVNTRGELRTKWEGIRFGDSQTQSIDKGLNFRVEVFLNGIGTDQVSVEVYADGLPGGDAEVIKLELDPSTEQLSLRLYHAKIITSRPASDYTIRVIPEYEGVLIPMEDNQILWQH